MVTRLNAIAIVTADMARSLHFYRALGLEIPDGAEKEPHVDVEIAPGVRLMWDTQEIVRSIHTDWTPASGGHAISLAVECDSPAQVDAVHDRVVRDGAVSVKSPWDAFWGQRYAVLRDPDGNLVDLYASLDG